MESGAIPDGSITASSFHGGGHEPYNGRLNLHRGFGAWLALYSDGQWLQVDLGELKRVTGTIIQGRPTYAMWATSFKLQYSNVEKNTPVTNLLNNPVDARYVRFLPQTWYGQHIGMRVEIVGCNTTAVPPTCPHMLGMESGAIPDNSITASSFHSADFVSYHGRLNGVAGGGAWMAISNTIGQWLQVDLGEMKHVMGTIIQSRHVYFMWVTSFKLQYSTDRITWTTYAGSNGSEMVFPGNAERHTPVTNLLDNSTDARYVRFLPQSWYRGIGMRVEIVGCNTTAVPPACPYMLGMESGAIPDESITSSAVYSESDSYRPYNGRLNGVAGGGAWIPYNIIGQWLQVDLGEMKRVMGTIIQGRLDYEHWVFPGNVYMNTPVTNLLNNSFDARYVRFVILSRLDRIAMRAEIVGCNTTAVIPVCPHMFGMESGAIPDDRITASSFQHVGSEPYLGRLNGVAVVGAWVSKYNSIGEWLRVNLGEMKLVMGTIIQGRRTDDQWVQSYKLQYSFDGITWTTAAGSDGSEMVFTGNVDRNTPVTNLLDNPIDASYVRFLPQTWHREIAMRAEIVGCHTTCNDPLGMESGAIPDDSITASSYARADTAPYRGRLNEVDGVGAWIGGWTDAFNIGQWLQC
ncbi:uncharacterized protein [Branchiostoma lanceolatum]|uniref:uncharacterized protein n=1 Tax=Branchiostoma lanceolatum TaxID=7740 RepID=UPI003451C80B